MVIGILILFLIVFIILIIVGDEIPPDEGF